MKSTLATEVDSFAARVRELFHYDQETGLFTRLVRTSNCVRVGESAGVLLPAERRAVMSPSVAFAIACTFLYSFGHPIGGSVMLMCLGLAIIGDWD